MRFLGVDYGSKRVGLASSDEEGKLAFPKTILKNGPKLFDELEKIIKDENIQAIVVGESMDFSGEENPINKAIEGFKGVVSERFGLPVYKQQEFLTSVGARQDFMKPSSSSAHSRMKKQKDEHVDAKAATLILQRYLDKNNNI